jgi:hypothetical protein
VGSIQPILKKLRSKAAISDEDLNALQVHVDVLERLTSAAGSHHHTTTHHDTTVRTPLEEEA